MTCERRADKAADLANPQRTSSSRTAGERERGILVALTLTSVVLAAPLLLHRWAPVADLGDHELTLAGLLGYGDSVRFPREVYRLQLGAANQLVFAIGLPLARAFGSNAGARLLAAAIVASFPWAVAAAARACNRSRFVAVALAPLVLGAPFRWGLLGFLLATSLFFFALGSLEVLARAPSPKRAARAAAWLVVASLAHGSAAVLAPLVVAPWLWMRRREPGLARAFAWNASALAPALAIVIAQVREFDASATPEFRAHTDVEHPRLGRFASLPDNLLGPFDGLSALLLVALLVGAMLPLSRRGPRGESIRVRLAVAAIVLAQYWIWPYGHNGAGLLYLRFLLPGAVLLGLAAAPAPHVPSRVSVLLLGAVPVGVTIALLPLYAASARTYASLDRLAPRVAEGSAIAGIDFRAATLEGASIVPRPAAHLVALRGGRTWAFPDVPQCVLRVRDEASWYRSDLRIQNPRNFIPEIDFTRYRYLVVAVPEDAMVPALVRALGPCGDIVDYQAPIALFESRCLAASPTTPDAPLPPTYPKTLGWRLRHLLSSVPGCEAEDCAQQSVKWP